MGLVGGAIGGILGGIAGSKPEQNSQNNTYGVNVGPMSALGNQGQGYLSSAASALNGMVQAGPGQADITNAYNSNQDLAVMLQKYQNGGNLPTAQDESTANNLAASMFNPQRTALQQQFQQQQWQAGQTNALMGRSASDPVLMNKMFQTQTNANAQLNAQQGAYANQYAMQMPGQRLGYAMDRNQLMTGLASQAMANRQALASMGSGIMNGERNWNYLTAQHYGNTSQSSGGGLRGGLMGAMAGFGAGMSMGSPSGSPSQPSKSSGGAFGNGGGSMFGGASGGTDLYGGGSAAGMVPIA